MITISVTLSPKVSNLASVMDPAHRQNMMFLVSQDLVEEIGQQFDSGGVHFLGRPWQDLSERRKAEREAKGTWPGQILVDTGALKRSRNSEATSETATVRLTQNYASTHEFGEGNVPQRKILPPENVAKEIARKSVDAYVDTVIKGLG